MRAAAVEERGVTLVELLISMSILGLIMTALSGALYVGISATTDDRRGLGQSNAEQIVAFYLAPDVQAACNPAGTASCTRNPNPSTSAGSTCGSSGSPQFAIDVLTDATATAASTTIVYTVQNGVLSRIVCPVGAGSPTSTTQLTSNVTGLTATYPSTGACAGSLQVSVTIAGSTAAGGTEPYTFTVCARRRAS